MVDPHIKTWKRFLHLNSLIFVLMSWTTGFDMVSNCAVGKRRKRDVTTAFAYSHLNTPIDQWECAYCLKYAQ